MSALPLFPSAIHRYIEDVFSGANQRICEKIARVPNCPEPSIDLTLIEHLSQFSGPRLVVPGWAVQIDVHYLGGMRHFHNWEIADIGLMVFAKRQGRVLAKKLAILQSKRLYPDKGEVVAETIEDFNLGMGRLLPGGGVTAPLGLRHVFAFSPSSKYAALGVGDQQYKAIKEYEGKRRIPVHYLLYNPWRVPATYSLPILTEPKLGRKGNGGARVLPAANLRAALSRRAAGYTPTFADLTAAVSNAPSHASGWRLEHFVSNLVMKCQQGHVFQDMNDENIFALFNRRSGPIAAAVSVTIEQLTE